MFKDVSSFVLISARWLVSDHFFHYLSSPLRMPLSQLPRVYTLFYLHLLSLVLVFWRGRTLNGQHIDPEEYMRFSVEVKGSWTLGRGWNCLFRSSLVDGLFSSLFFLFRMNTILAAFVPAKNQVEIPANDSRWFYEYLTIESYVPTCNFYLSRLMSVIKERRNCHSF